MKQDKWKPVHGLLKQPNVAIIKSQAIEIGGLKSHIDELEHELNQAREDLKRFSNTDKKDYKKEVQSLNVALKERNSHIKGLTKKNKQLQEEVYSLMYKTQRNE